MTMEQDKTRKERLLKTFNNENRLWQGIDKLIKRLLVESVTGYGEECNKSRENRIPTEAAKSLDTHNDVEKVAPTSFMHSKVNNAPKLSLVRNATDRSILNKASKTLECCKVEAVVPNKAPINLLTHKDVKIVPKKAQKSLADCELHAAVPNTVPKTLANSEVATTVLEKASINSFALNDVKLVSNKLPKLSLNNEIEKSVPNEASKHILSDFNVATKKTDKGSPKTFYLPIASILTHPTNLKVNKVVAKTSSNTTLFSTKKSKHELVEKGTDPIQIMLPDDEELRFQQVNLNYTFNVGILTARTFQPLFIEESQKVMVVMGQQTSPKDNEETREDENTPKKTKSPTESQQVKETTSTANSTILQNQKTIENVQQYSKRNEPRQKQNTITIDDNPKIISSQPLLEKKKSGKGKRKSVKNKEEVETSSQLSKVQTNLLMGTSTSKAAMPYYGSSDKIPEYIRGRELIVIKEPDELDNDVDDFIPPVANKSYVIDSNIIKTETLDEETENDDERCDTHFVEDNDRQNLPEEAEVSKTINPENSEASYTVETLTERANITTTDLHSKCDTPTKQPSQSNLQVLDVSSDPENVAIVEALKQFSSSSQWESYSPENSDLDSFRNLDQFDCCDEFDETLKQSSSMQKKIVAESYSQNDPSLNEQIDRKLKDLNSELDGSVALVRRESGGS